MLSAIILLPLIILLILSVSTVIVSSTNHIYVENVEIVDAEQTLTLIKSDDTVPTYQLKVNIFPMLASNKNLVYWSDDDSVASVDKNGVIYGNDFGTTYIYVKSQENEIKTSMRKVVVTDTKVHRIEVANRVDRMYLGDEVQLEYSVKPSDAENTGVTFSSDNPSVLSVSLTGLITAVGAGEATVTLASDDGNASVSFVVSVKSRIENAADYLLSRRGFRNRYLYLFRRRRGFGQRGRLYQLQKGGYCYRYRQRGQHRFFLLQNVYFHKRIC